MTMAAAKTSLRIGMSLALLGAVAACGNGGDDGSTTGFGLARQAVGQIAASAGVGDGKAEPAQPAKSPEQMAAEALRVNPGPLILVGLESQGRSQVMAMTGQNGDMRTFMTPSEQAVILRGGMLVGTKGLGHDLSVAEADASAALIRARRSGQVSRTMRYLVGDGLERPLPMDCTISPGPNAGVMVEDCRAAGGVAIQNSYLPQGGSIPVSRQWIGPDLGYITIQVLRP